MVISQEQDFHGGGVHLAMPRENSGYHNCGSYWLNISLFITVVQLYGLLSTAFALWMLSSQISKASRLRILVLLFRHCPPTPHVIEVHSSKWWYWKAVGPLRSGVWWKGDGSWPPSCAGAMLLYFQNCELKKQFSFYSSRCFVMVTQGRLRHLALVSLPFTYFIYLGWKFQW